MNLRSKPVKETPKEIPDKAGIDKLFNTDEKKFETAHLLRTNCNCKNQETHSWDDPKCKMYIPFINKGQDGFGKLDTLRKYSSFGTTEAVRREEEVLVTVWNKAIVKQPYAFHDMMDSGTFTLEQAKLIVKGLEEAGYWIIERDF